MTTYAEWSELIENKKAMTGVQVPHGYGTPKSDHSESTEATVDLSEEELKTFWTKQANQFDHCGEALLDRIKAEEKEEEKKKKDVIQKKLPIKRPWDVPEGI